MSIQVGIFMLLLLAPAGAVPSDAQMASVDTEDIKWGINPAIPGAKFAVIHGNPGQPGPFVVRVWLPANFSVAAHRHPNAENVTVLWGTLYAGMADKLDRDKSKAYPAGGFVHLPGDHAHFIWSKEETLIQVHGIGPTAFTYVDPADDPRKK
jgi:hypothetical protein